MNEYNEEEIVGMCEAYQAYQLLPEEYQKKIPTEFVKDMEKCSENKLGISLNCVEDIKSKKLSREGVKRIAYMCLFLK